LTPQTHYKDEILDQLSLRSNVAQFVSFAPDGSLRYARIFGVEAGFSFATKFDAIAMLLKNSTEKSVNVRSFDPSDPKSKEFVYGLRSVGDAVDVVNRLGASGLYTIVNETIDVEDGGVSGVAMGDVIEFAPKETPRCVEKPGTASLPKPLGLRMLETVYGFSPALPFDEHTRVEFSIHPLRRGVKAGHTIIWETERVGESLAVADLQWPNKFSQFIGDKAFGLLVAHLIGLPVPYSLVISRNVQPFSFGRATKTGETWIRTCPIVQVPGKFTTRRGWIDPFALLAQEDPEGTEIGSVLAQEGVDAKFSGAILSSLRTDEEKEAITIEGTSGYGDEFMVGIKPQVDLPAHVKRSVRRLYYRASKAIGPTRMEWVFDGKRSWVVQFHKGASVSYGNTIVPGKPSHFITFPVDRGLEALRTLIEHVRGSDVGIELRGEVGITSHFGDVLRRARIPSRITKAAT
jgi:hypothetical protein